MKSSIPYVYLFVRDDLSIPQQIVQTAHAVDCMRSDTTSDDVNHMVLIGARGQDELIAIARYLSDCDIKHEMFFEPDISAYTAIATQPLRGHMRSALKRYKLKQ